MIKRKNFIALLLALLLALSGCSKEKGGTIAEGDGILITPSESKSERSQSESEQSESEPEHSQSTPETSQSASESSGEESSAAEAGGEYGETDPCLILVNPENYIPDDYTVELETVQGKYKLDVKAAQSAKDLIAGAKEAGYDMQICSAYRTIEKSAELYQRKVQQYLNAGYSQAKAESEAAKWVAPPGTSEHHTGLAMDIVSSDYWGQYSDLEHDYEKFDSFKWMYEHCAEYGFILRYPKDKQDITGITYEPWHYRYVGVEAATYIMENGLCLEEYLDLQ